LKRDTLLHAVAELSRSDADLAMSVRRFGPPPMPDIWPQGDLALALAARQVKRLRTRPTEERLRRVAAYWRPWRAVAARILWHHYLSERRLRQRSVQST
jgi:hypothetical protein